MRGTLLRGIGVVSVLAFLVVVGYYIGKPYLEKQQMKANLPEPPPGYAWQAIPELSDEFKGKELDRGKWLDHHPYWEGRTPSRFDRSNVSVADGVLRLASTTEVEDLAEVEDPEQDVWVRSACVASEAPIASYGYYEARVKASRLSMTSSFWLQGQYSEIDVVEQLGDPIREPWKRGVMLINTHYYKGGWEDDRKTPVKWEMPVPSADEYHVYGVWWVDESTIRLYHDGEQVAEVETGGAFLEPMYLFFDTEVFVWEGLPTIESLHDPERNAMSVDWVRAWNLAEIKE